MNPHGIKPLAIDTAELARWNRANKRAREEYAANPLANAGNGHCDYGTCQNKTGARRFCWLHRVDVPMEAS